ncbi:hypothetical protein R6U77_19750 [Lysinibacillus louembei]|uniref:Uncharacterized protein n=1 Tax=Lysinibacillus louembei TaxID=1470088 RepID=A0ABZ0RYK9_9BACI|nr:hypothetical protein [Lysinibacillus louembei]WPK12096.1 hypothetical protein R6U77_19750 [Lysinibacillus louembei]
MKRKIFKFLFVLTSFILVFASMPFVNNVSASTMQAAYSEFDLEAILNSQKEAIFNETGEVIDFNVLSDNEIEIISEDLTYVINTDTYELTLNGENLGVVAETEIEYYDDIPAITSFSAYTPVKYTTITTTAKKIAGEITSAAIYLGIMLIVGVAILGQMGVTVPAILTTAKSAITSFGLSATAQIMGDVIDAVWSYSIYRTTSPVPTGYGSNQIAYRYQDATLTARFKVGNLTTPQWSYKSTEIGSWWFSDKPY